jgi:dihydrofolate synthase/folylpolyglutamate synthase
MAIQVVHILKENYSVNVLQLHVGIEAFYWPGRMEIFNNVILDGAHNLSGIKSFLNETQKLYPNKKLLIIFGAMKSKDYSSMLRTLASSHLVKQLVVVPLEGSRACNQNDYKNVITKYKLSGIVIENSVEVAFNKYKPRTDDIILCCVGSLHLVGRIKKIMGGNRND